MSDTSEADPLTAAARDATAAISECLKGLRSSYTAAIDRTYTPEMWAKDMAQLWACGVKGWAKVVTDVGLVAAGLSKIADEATTAGSTDTDDGSTT